MKRLSETTSKSKVSLASLVLRVISAVLCSHVEKEKKTKTQQHECMLQDFYREKNTFISPDCTEQFEVPYPE